MYFTRKPLTYFQEDRLHLEISKPPKSILFKLKFYSIIKKKYNMYFVLKDVFFFFQFVVKNTGRDKKTQIEKGKIKRKI